jgi:hypothetical protein
MKWLSNEKHCSDYRKTKGFKILNVPRLHVLLVKVGWKQAWKSR